MAENEKLSVLVLDDDATVRKVVRSYLEGDFSVQVSSAPSEALKILEKEETDIVISDISLPEMSGLDFIAKVKESYPDIEIIMITSYPETDYVIEAMRTGAIDFFKKPVEKHELLTSIKRTQKFIEVEQELKSQKNRVRKMQEVVTDKYSEGLIGKSEKIMKVKEQMYKVAQSPDTSVMITGESGTGKELVARGIHSLSSRSDRFFGAVNTSAINENLFESEFFGYKKGAFTGAEENRSGWFEVADGGTLFLDEIAEIPSGLQAKLLRALEEGKFIPVGGQKEKKFDIRVISATNKSPEEIRSGKYLRQDLYFRLATFEVHVPPLRERREDIPLIAESFLRFLGRKLGKNVTDISPEALDILMSYDYPGNVRELRNLLERAVILCEEKTLKKGCFKQIDRSSQNTDEGDAGANTFDLQEVEKQTIQKALEAAGYNKSRAAGLLNINWNALDRRMKKYGLEK